MSFNSMCLVNATAFNNGKVDKNGESPVLLNVLAGKAPNRTVISGTIAKRNGFEVGKMYIVQITEGEPNEQYGRQFNINKRADATVADMFTAIASLGKAEIFSVEGANAEVEQPVAIEIADEK
jgi:hypothetical protein